MIIKKIIMFSLTFSVTVLPVRADAMCFLAQENHDLLKQEGECETRHSPCSTFKIAISLMGYNEDILIDETHPEWPFQEGYADWLDIWKQPHHPTLWMKNSCVWYSQLITSKLGMEKFQEYLIKFDYGNYDSSGDQGQNNGLTHAWLNSSLEISPVEQVKFLTHLVDHTLPVSQNAQDMTQHIMLMEELPGGWKLYGKTGSGTNSFNHLVIGWFVGWVVKEERTIIFAYYLEEKRNPGQWAGKHAYQLAKEKLFQLLK